MREEGGEGLGLPGFGPARDFSCQSAAASGAGPLLMNQRSQAAAGHRPVTGPGTGAGSSLPCQGCGASSPSSVAVPLRLGQLSASHFLFLTRLTAAALQPLALNQKY